MNRYKDTPELEARMHSPLMERIVELKENFYSEAGKYDFAPSDLADAMDNFDRVLELTGSVCDEVIALNAESVDREGFDMLFKLADVLHAEVGASRAAVDAGFVDHDRQIGQTGLTVRPKLYIACGISGQIQHIAGMRESSLIMSINQDPDAPINAIADYVVTGRVEDVIPKLIRNLKEISK